MRRRTENKPRKRMSAEDRRKAILETTVSFISQFGFWGFTIRDVAQAQNITEAGLLYYFKSKENLYREVLESIIDPILRASTPFNADGEPNEVLSHYIRSKIMISRDLPFASKVFASEIMHGAPHLSEKQVELLNAQAKHNIECIQVWIDRGQIAPIDPHHLMFSIWAATQTYADFDWQISAITGKAKLDDNDYEAATRTIIRLVLKGCTPD